MPEMPHLPHMPPLRKREIAARAWDSMGAEDRRLTLHVLYVDNNWPPFGAAEEEYKAVREEISSCVKLLFSQLPSRLQEALRKKVKGYTYKPPFERVQVKPSTPEEEKENRLWKGYNPFHR
mgnify:CR=1 FL=1